MTTSLTSCETIAQEIVDSLGIHTGDVWKLRGNPPTYYPAVSTRLHSNIEARVAAMSGAQIGDLIWNAPLKRMNFGMWLEVQFSGGPQPGMRYVALVALIEMVELLVPAPVPATAS